jgi:hypothetical protein
MDCGVTVYGASSMGALRAAELTPFGMIGVGQIYRDYASGELTDDDEVALAYGVIDGAYRAISEPMVNIRATLAAARDAHVISAELEQRLTAIAKSLFFPERTYDRLLYGAAEADVPPDVRTRLRAFIREHAIDVKRRDAVALLEQVRQAPTVPRNASIPRLERTAAFEGLYQRDRRVRHDETDVALGAIASYAALHLPDFDQINAHALNRALVSVLADTVGIDVTGQEIDAEAGRMRAARNLADDAVFDAWLRKQNWSAEEFRTLARESARRHVLYRWFSLRKAAARTTQYLLDELRLTDLYEETARGAAGHARLIAEHDAPLHAAASKLPTPRLVVDHARATGCPIPVAFGDWAEESGFHSPDVFRAELLQARFVRQLALERTLTALSGSTP